jgi:hypothetical protein
MVAQLLEPLDETAAESCAVDGVEVVGSKVAILHVVRSDRRRESR